MQKRYSKIARSSNYFVSRAVGLSAAIHLRDEDGNAGIATDDDMKAFIQSLLDQHKKELLQKIRLIEFVNKRDDWVDDFDRGTSAGYLIGYNQAVSDLEEIKKQL